MRTLKMIQASALVAVVLLTAGCLDTDLELVNPNEPTVEGFWQTEGDAIAAMDAVYRTLGYNGTWGRNGYWVWGRTDTQMSRSPASALLNLHRSVITNLNYNSYGQHGLWEEPYEGIFQANQVIHRVPEMEIDQNLKDQLVAEARFIRGLYHMELAIRFGDVPLRLEVAELGEQPTFTAREDVWEHVATDVASAASDLPWTWSGMDIGRVTRGGALALAAEARMMRGEYGQAATLLQEIVDSGQYDLVPNYEDVFNQNGDNTVESLFEVQFGTQGDRAQGAPSNWWPRLVAPSSGAGPSIGFNDTQPTTWGVAMFFQEDGDWDARTGADPRLEHTYFYYDRPADDPSYAGMDVFGMPFRDRYINTGPEGGPGFRDAEIQETFFFKKYQEYWLPSLGNFASPLNLKIYRLGKVYLMLAEALVETGDLDGAVDALEPVRLRVGLDPVPGDVDTGDQQSMRDWVNREYILETSVEGNTRYNYMTRQGLVDGDWYSGTDPVLGLVRNQWHSNTWAPHRRILPIPQPEIDRNPNATQNPGW